MGRLPKPTQCNWCSAILPSVVAQRAHSASLHPRSFRTKKVWTRLTQIERTSKIKGLKRGLNFPSEYAGHHLDSFDSDAGDTEIFCEDSAPILPRESDQRIWSFWITDNGQFVCRTCDGSLNNHPFGENMLTLLNDLTELFNAAPLNLKDLVGEAVVKRLGRHQPIPAELFESGKLKSAIVFYLMNSSTAPTPINACCCVSTQLPSS